MGKMDVTAFLVLSAIGMAFILSFHPEGRAGAQGTLCGTTDYSRRDLCVYSGCAYYCRDQASLQNMAVGNFSCIGSTCKCFCTPGTLCSSTRYWQGCSEAPNGGCQQFCKDQAELLHLTYGGHYCLPGDMCTCYCRARA